MKFNYGPGLWVHVDHKKILKDFKSGVSCERIRKRYGIFKHQVEEVIREQLLKQKTK